LLGAKSGALRCGPLKPAFGLSSPAVGVVPGFLRSVDADECFDSFTGAPLLAGFARSGDFDLTRHSAFGKKLRISLSESRTSCPLRPYVVCMPWGLKRYHETEALHFITWSCCDRQPLLGTSEKRDLLLRVLEQMRNRYRFGVVGFVVMPEHVNLLMSEPLVGNASTVIGAVKLGFTRRVMTENPHFEQRRPEVRHPTDLGRHFWMKRYYDFNVYSDAKIGEKLHYMHENPVVRGLVQRPEQWR